MLIFLCRLFFMFMLCVIFDSRDVKVDKIRSLSSLATTVSPQKIHLIILFSLVAFLLTDCISKFRGRQLRILPRHAHFRAGCFIDI